MRELTQEKIKVFETFKGNTPCYILFEKDILENIKRLKSFPAPFGLQVRFAMKANPNLALLKLMDKNDVWIDSSSTNECYRALAAGIDGSHILFTSQDVPSNEALKDLIDKGVEYNATSLTQLEKYGKLFPNTDITVRFNIGIGSGWNTATNTGGPTSSFGIYNQNKEVKELLNKYNLNLKRIHLHIGSGSTAKKQEEAAIKGLEVTKEFETVEILNLGGGFKIARMPDETETDVIELGSLAAKQIEKFESETGRKIKVEIEPGGAAIGNEGYILGTIKDIVTTGEFDFIKLDTGMTDNTRTPMYGAQHPIFQINKEGEEKDYVVVGSCCESGDILTCKPNEPEELEPRKFKNPLIGDMMIIGGAGAYCSSMAVFNYNTKQRSPEYLIRTNGNIDEIRKRQKLEEVWCDDVIPSDI